MSTLRLALLDHTEGAYSRELEAALRGDGHDMRLLGQRAAGPVEALLRRRGFTSALSHIPPAVSELLHGEFDLVHAFSAPDAVAALAWRRVSKRPVVFTCTETLSRATVADRRLRLRLLDAAVTASDAVLALDDAAAHARLYARLA